MALARIDFHASNNADWVREFSLNRPAAAALPWVNVAQWSDMGVYQASSPASIVVHDDNLYLAVGASNPTEGVFVESEWLMIGSAEAYSAEPFDLTGTSLAMRLVSVLPSGELNTDVTALLLKTEDGTLEITSAVNGGVRINLPVAKARGVAPGTYAYDLLARKGAASMRLLSGQVTIDQGVTR